MGQFLVNLGIIDMHLKMHNKEEAANLLNAAPLLGKLMH